ncbi:hypothetical protein FHS61_000951 [Altererythrobacter atlanticus]|uniref:Uncharacterized protein n=2 Tax=Croceibacterium atlanticum TaxID=1267766 RepID=A0A0F7KVW6_9SPHN|nr:hypothetical protein [Croceibacterium atlanticum]AKH43347.1 hypothetical protein WYH_02315 [Croceibacterium atlanticum]MBB5731947.1 hypothetical protein [Croceibacterium atlanticum]
MHRSAYLILAPCALLSLGGCLAKTALDVATAPVKIASKGVDLATTSQSEADEKRGREIRKREERLGKLEREYTKQLERCQEGYRNACNDATKTYAEMQQVAATLPTYPAENEDD